MGHWRHLGIFPIFFVSFLSASPAFLERECVWFKKNKNISKCNDLFLRRRWAWEKLMSCWKAPVLLNVSASVMVATTVRDLGNGTNGFKVRKGLEQQHTRRGSTTKHFSGWSNHRVWSKPNISWSESSLVTHLQTTSYNCAAKGFVRLRAVKPAGCHGLDRICEHVQKPTT